MPSSRIVFVTVDSWDNIPASQTKAVVALKWDSWDDFGFKTTFHVQLQLPGKKLLDLGTVKILHLDQTGGKTPLEEKFTHLQDAYCSIGQSLAYYEMLRKLGSWYRDYLEGLRDVVFSPIILSSFKDHTGFTHSLIRSSGAEIALTDAQNLFPQVQHEQQPDRPDQLAFTMQTTVGGHAFTLDVNLGAGELQERCAVVIGYNATGKTKLLGNIGMVASRKENDPGEQRIRRDFGQFTGPSPRLSGVLAISYSAFDTFEIPLAGSDTDSPTSRSREDAEGQRGYLYCGLRKGGQSSSELKGSNELTAEFLAGLERCKSRDLKDRFLRCMTILAEEPSMHEYSTLSTLMQKGEEKCRSFYESLSTGHKLVLKVATQLVAYLQPSSLVLFDEPETHLHPSLVAALMKCLRLLLQETASFSIVATHSPVVIQETPSRNVYLLRRNGRLTTVDKPSIETFGENIGILTAEIFDLNASESDYRHTLQTLASRSLDDIDQLFAKPLGTQARSFLRSLQKSEK